MSPDESTKALREQAQPDGQSPIDTFGAFLFQLGPRRESAQRLLVATGKEFSRVAPFCTAEVAFAVTCQGGYAAAMPDIALLRQRPLPFAQSSLPASFLRHADEQTVVGLASVGQAVAARSGSLSDYRDWGVIAAPRYQGRVVLADAVERFGREGAWCVSPHLIPHRSLHSQSGTVSLALGSHGPNFGVGGGPGGFAEALIVGAALLADRNLPGVWLLATGWEPELLPHSSGDTDTVGERRGVSATCICWGVALALRWPGANAAGWDLRLGRDESQETAAPFLLSALAAELAAPSGSQPKRWSLEDGRFVVLRRRNFPLRDCA
jgi:hypothetical protein